jgi:hypothetical protein
MWVETKKNQLWLTMWMSMLEVGPWDVGYQLNILRAPLCISFLRHQKPKQQKKPWKKGKINCVFFWNGIVVGGQVKSVQRSRQQGNV